MNDDSGATPIFKETTGNEIPAYRHWNLWGPLALVAGLASAAALDSPLLWAVAGFGLVIGVLAVQSVARRGLEADPWRLATIGFALSLFFVTAAPTRYLLRQWHIRQQASEVGEEWLGFFLSHQPYKAYESLNQAEFRYPLDGGLLTLYQDDASRAEVYRAFLNVPLVKALMLLPSSAVVRHYENESIEPYLSGGGNLGGDLVTDVFAVTYQENGQQKSFFVRIVLWRRDQETSPRGLWQVLRYEGGVRPWTLPAA